MRTIARGLKAAIDLPSNRIAPERGGARPEIARSVVDLPAPLAPSNAMTAPSSIENETPRSASISPYWTLTSLSSSNAITKLRDRLRPRRAREVLAAVGPSAMRLPKLSTVRCRATPAIRVIS